jgi:hypothetical protein
MSSTSFEQMFGKDPIFDKLTSDIYRTAKKIERTTDSQGYMKKYLDEARKAEADIKTNGEKAWNEHSSLDPSSRKRLTKQQMMNEKKAAYDLLDAKYPHREEAFTTTTRLTGDKNSLTSMKLDGSPKRKRKPKAKTESKPKAKPKPKAKK